MSCHFISCHVMSFHFISCHFISCHFISFHVMSFHFISFHVISFHVISFHFFRWVSKSFSNSETRSLISECGLHSWFQRRFRLASGSKSSASGGIDLVAGLTNKTSRCTSLQRPRSNIHKRCTPGYHQDISGPGQTDCLNNLNCI